MCENSAIVDGDGVLGLLLGLCQTTLHSEPSTFHLRAHSGYRYVRMISVAALQPWPGALFHFFPLLLFYTSLCALCGASVASVVLAPGRVSNST